MEKHRSIRKHKITRICRIGWEDAYTLMRDEGYMLSGRRLLDPWERPEFYLTERSKALLMREVERRVCE